MHNKSYITALALVAVLGLSSCSKFLDIQPVGKVIPTTTEDYRALMTKAYDFPLGSDRGLTEMRSDIARSRNQSFDLNLYGDLMKWNDRDYKAGAYTWGWAGYYTSIYYANAIIAQGERISGDAAERRQLLGEAYLHRAYLHFLLVNLYGKPYTQEGAKESKAVPLKLDVDLEGTLSRSTVGDIYTQILADISAAKRALQSQEWANESQRYRYTRLSALALEARVQLYRGAWDEAYKAAEEALQSKSTLEDLNAPTAKLPNLYNSAEMIQALELLYNSASGRALRAEKAFVERYAEGDLRRAKYFGVFDTKEQYYQVAKVDGTTKYRCSFRVGELYLTSAEAAAQMGRFAEARTRLLALMKARYTPEAYAGLAQRVEALSGAELVSFILTERAKDLAFEGHRWFDLRRTSRPALVKGDAKLEANDPRYTLPIPREAIEANPALLN